MNHPQNDWRNRLQHIIVASSLLNTKLYNKYQADRQLQNTHIFDYRIRVRRCKWGGSLPLEPWWGVCLTNQYGWFNEKQTGSSALWYWWRIGERVGGEQCRALSFSNEGSKKEIPIRSSYWRLAIADWRLNNKRRRSSFRPLGSKSP